MSSAKRVALFHNSSAGSADHDQRVLTAAIEVAGWRVEYVDVKTTDIAAVLRDPGDLIAIAGGDGTVRRVALMAAPDGPPITILPLGTANNLANSLGIRGPFPQLIAGWRDGALTKFHPLEVEASWGRRRLIEGAGFGVLAEFIEEARGKQKQLPLEARKRIADRVRLARPIELGLAVDDERIPGPVILLEVTTIPLIGPSLYLAPRANPSRRLVEACYVLPEQRDDLAAWLDHPPSDGSPAPVTCRTGSRVGISGALDRIRVDDDVRICDEQTGTITFIASAEPLSFLVPGLAPGRA